MAKSETSPMMNLEPCMMLNVSQCATSEESDSFVVTVYNPLARVVSHFVRLPVPLSAYKVLDPKGKLKFVSLAVLVTQRKIR